MKKEGEYVFRFLPPLPPANNPIVPVNAHWVTISGKRTKIICPQKHAGRPCPVCKRVIDLERSGNPSDRNAAYEIKAKTRFFANVINRDNEAAGPRVLEFGKMIYDELLRLRKSARDGFDWTDPTAAGRDVIIERHGMGKDDTEYSVRPSLKASPLGNMDWILDQYDLGSYCIPPSADDLVRMLHSSGSGGGGGDARSQRRLPRGGSGRPVDPEVVDSSDIPY